MAFRIRSAARWFAFVGLLAWTAGAQTFVFSTTVDQAATPVAMHDEELWGFDATGRWPMLTHEMLGILTGDTDGNGIFDDQPVDVDAAHASGLPYPGNFHLSVTADFHTADGTLVKDGDIFHFTNTGVAIDLPESFFEGVTGTTQVDVDGFAVAPNGDIYFSFGDDETTTNAGLIAQNGGSATLDEQCVFRFVPGAAAATIFLTPLAAVSAFNHAFGTTATTVVDVGDLEIDPFNPGELLLTSLSTATAFRGKVITTAGGGAQFILAGQPIGPPALGLPSTAQLDAIAIVTAPKTPVLRAIPEVISAATPILASVTSSGWAPGAPVQFVYTPAAMPRPTFLAYAGTTGYTASPLDPASPELLASFTVASWLIPADATGTATYSFGTGGIPPGLNAVVQAVDLGSLTISPPVSVVFVP